ncbi:hypothetical protein VPHK567_0019 [Vibrio phage K567]
MKNVIEVRKDLAETGVCKRRNVFQNALEELLELRELTIYDIVYSLNDGKFDETLRRKVHGVLARNEQFACISQDTASGRRTYTLTANVKAKRIIEVDSYTLTRSPLLGLEKILTEVLNDGLGQSVQAMGVCAIDEFKALPVKKQVRYIMSLAKTSRREELLEIFTKSGFSVSSPKWAVENALRSNARYVIAKVNERHEFFDNVIKNIYG